MATIIRENLDVLNDTLSITVAKSDYYTSFEKTLNKYSKSASIHGFRKGMVPAGLIKKMYGSSVMTEEIIRTVEKELQQYLIAEKLDIFAQPLPLESDIEHININNPIDYTFRFELGLKPSFEVETVLEKAHFTHYKIDPTEVMIDEEMQRVQENFATTVDQEAATTENHIINIHFEESDAEGTVLANGISEKITLKISDFNTDGQHYFLNKKKGDVFVIDPKIYIDFAKKAWIANQLEINTSIHSTNSKHFKATIENVFLREKASIDETLFNKLYPNQNITTEIDCRKKIKEDIELYWKNQCNQKLYDDIYHYLLDHTPITLPNGFLKRWLQYSDDKKEKTVEQIEQEFPKFQTQLKWTLISEKLIQKNHVKVSTEEVQNHIAEQVINYYRSMGLNLDTQESWLAGYISKLMQDKERVEGAYRQLQDIKLFEILGQQVKTTEQPISEKEFEKITSEHKH